MKKKTITVGVLLLAMASFAQTDTSACSISGKEKYEFDYYSDEINKITSPEKYKDYKFKLKKNEILYLDLLDGIERDTLYLLHRHITVYYRDGEIEELSFDSDNNTLTIDGVYIQKIVVSKPELK